MLATTSPIVVSGISAAQAAQLRDSDQGNLDHLPISNALRPGVAKTMDGYSIFVVQTPRGDSAVISTAKNLPLTTCRPIVIHAKQVVVRRTELCKVSNNRVGSDTLVGMVASSCAFWLLVYGSS